jgi:chromosome partitioning protein
MEDIGMSASIIAITNQKGGVGKTTTAAALLSSLHHRGARTLGVDLDPQGSLGFSLGLDIDRCATIYDVFRGSAQPEAVISHTETCDLLPSNILLSGADLEFNRPGREFLLKNALSRVEENYDYIIVDTPPSLNLLTVNAYVAADGLIIPMAPEVLSLLGVSQIKETIESVRNYYNDHLEVLGILLNRYSARFNLNREVLELAGQIADQVGTRVFQAKIRGSVAAAEAPAHGQSVVDYAPHSNPALDFEDLCDEVAGSRFPRRDKRGGTA